MVDPILIAGCPRSGTSMTAGILHAHGVAVGRHRSHAAFNPKGSFENSDMKGLLHGTIKRHGMPLNPVFDDPAEPDLPGLSEKLRACVPGKGPWLLKETKLLWFYRNLSAQFPDAVWVLPVRPREDSIRSILRHSILPGRLRDAMRREGVSVRIEEAAVLYWDKCHARQSHIAAHSPHVWVDTDAVARGDERAAQALVEACGLTFAPEKVAAFVERDYWHA